MSKCDICDAELAPSEGVIKTSTCTVCRTAIMQALDDSDISQLYANESVIPKTEYGGWVKPYKGCE